MSQIPARRVYSAITSNYWAMTEEYISLMADIVMRDHDPVEAVERRLGRKLDNARIVTVRDGVATIPITGPIFRYADVFTEISGGATVETIAKDLTTALDDPAIQGIVLAIDSPGGQINGINELAEMIAGSRGVKPIVAYAGHMMASAAYWIGAAADRVVIDASAMIGSIGVRTTLRDPSKAQGGGVIEFISSQSPHKRLDPTTETGRSRVQAEVDHLAAIFIESVARYRGVSADHVVAQFGQGGLVIGSDAVNAGMADSIGSYESVLTSLSASSSPSAFGLMVRDHQEVLVMTKHDETAQAEASVQAELTAMREQLALERSQRISAEAAAFVQAEISAGRVLPGERDGLIGLYAVLAHDDATTPRTPSRVEMFKQITAARPSHAMIGEFVPADPVVFASKTATPNADEAMIEASRSAAVAYAQRANGTKK